MQLVTLTEKDRADYNQFVINHSTGSFLQSWGWGDWQASLGNTAHRFFAYDGSTPLLAAQVLEMRLPAFRSKIYLYCPYGPLISGGSSASRYTVDFFIEQLTRLFPKHLFLRLEPKQTLPPTSHLQRPTASTQPAQTLTINLSQSTDQILTAMHPKTRYNIKVAAKRGVMVHAEPVVTPRYGLYLKESVGLMVATAQRQRFRTHDSAYYRKFIDFFSRRGASLEINLEIYQALFQNRLLACAFMLDCGHARTYLFGGSTQTHKNVMAPYLLHWQAILDAQHKGLRQYDFWGVETAAGDIPGFVRFKRGFGGDIVTYPGARDIIIHRAWYNIYKTIRVVNRWFKHLA